MTGGISVWEVVRGTVGIQLVAVSFHNRGYNRLEAAVYSRLSTGNECHGSNEKSSFGILVSGSMAQAVRRSPPTARIPSSRLCRDGRKGVWIGFSPGFFHFPLPQVSFRDLSTFMSFVSFHFTSSAPVMVHQAWSAGILTIKTFNKAVSSDLIPRPGSVSDTSCRYLFYMELW